MGFLKHLILKVQSMVIHFDVLEYRYPNLLPRFKSFSVDRFHFQTMEKAFRAGIVVTTTLGAHAAN